MCVCLFTGCTWNTQTRNVIMWHVTSLMDLCHITHTCVCDIQRAVCDWMFQLIIRNAEIQAWKKPSCVLMCYLQCQSRRWSASRAPTRTHSLSHWTRYLIKTQTHPQVRPHRTMQTSLIIRLKMNKQRYKWWIIQSSSPCQSSATVVVMNFMEKRTKLSLERSPLNFSGLYGETNTMLMIADST